MVRTRQIIQVTVIAIIFMFLGNNICKNWGEISRYEWEFNYPLLGLSFFFLLCTLFLTATAWNLILRKLGGNLKLGKALKIWFYSDLAKYITGKVWLVLERVHLCEKENLGRGNPFLSIGLEVALTIVSGVLIFLLSLIFWFHEELRSYLVLALLLVPMGAILYPPLLNKVIGIFQSV